MKFFMLAFIASALAISISAFSVESGCKDADGHDCKCESSKDVKSPSAQSATPTPTAPVGKANP